MEIGIKLTLQFAHRRINQNRAAHLGKFDQENFFGTRFCSNRAVAAESADPKKQRGSPTQ